MEYFPLKSRTGFLRNHMSKFLGSDCSIEQVVITSSNNNYGLLMIANLLMLFLWIWRRMKIAQLIIFLSCHLFPWQLTGIVSSTPPDSDWTWSVAIPCRGEGIKEKRHSSRQIHLLLKADSSFTTLQSCLSENTDLSLFARSVNPPCMTETTEFQPEKIYSILTRAVIKFWSNLMFHPLLL